MIDDLRRALRFSEDSERRLNAALVELRQRYRQEARPRPEPQPPAIPKFSLGKSILDYLTQDIYVRTDLGCTRRIIDCLRSTEKY